MKADTATIPGLGRFIAPTLVALLTAVTANVTSGAQPGATTADPSASAYRVSVNTIDTIVADMRRKNDLPLAGAPVGPGWTTGPGHVHMGNRPRGSATASWWQPSDRSLKSDAWWTVLLPWIVIFDGIGNGATNTRVEFRNLKAYYKSRKTGRWVLITQGPISGENYPKHLTGTRTVPPELRRERDGAVSVRPAGGNYAFHGWCCGPKPIDPPDIAAIHVTTLARLTLDRAGGPDDRDSAKYLMQVGADYYPDAKTKIAAFAPTGYNPGVGLSRFKLLTRDWQAISMTTIDVGVDDPRGGAITEAELRAAPPPLD